MSGLELQVKHLTHPSGTKDYHVLKVSQPGVSPGVGCVLTRWGKVRTAGQAKAILSSGQHYNQASILQEFNEAVRKKTREYTVANTWGSVLPMEPDRAQLGVWLRNQWRVYPELREVFQLDIIVAELAQCVTLHMDDLDEAGGNDAAWNLEPEPEIERPSNWGLWG